MAGKQYEMLFKLGAQLDQKFNGTFASAQKVLNATQKEIQALNKQQGDIASYQKQQTAVENTGKRLEMYREQLKNVQREKAEDGKATSDLVNKELALKRRIEETEQKLADQNTKLRQMEQNLTETGISTDHLKSTSMGLEQRIEMLSRAEEEAAEEAKQFGSEGENAFEMVGSALIAAGLATALKEIADAYKECVGVSMEFEATMSTVEALSGSTAIEMSELSAKAKELGATTVFTANQSAQAMTFMGMAGWDAQQMISGMNGVLNLAAASGEDLASVSDIVTDNLSAFKLEAADTAHFADVLAAAATNSNTSVGIMGETFKTSASIAGTLGYSIEDVAVQIGLMANKGVKASIAGTTLKNIFNGISSEITLTSKAFGEAAYTGVNLDGSMKELSVVIEDLRGYFDQMTESEKKANAQAIAGERGYNGLLAILESTEEEYRKVSDSINNCAGSAQRMADIKLDNLKGDIALLDSATDGLKMTLGGMWNNELRGLAQIGSDIINGINDFCEKNPVFVKSIMVSVTALGGVLMAVKGINAAKKLKSTWSTIMQAMTVKETAAENTNTAATITNTAATEAGTAAKIANAAALAGVAAAAVIVVAEFAHYADAIWDVSDAVEAAQDGLQDTIDKMNDSISQNDAEISVLRNKVSVYDELRNKQNRTAAEETKLAELADELQGTFGSEVKVVNSLTGEYNDLSAVLDNYVEKQSKKVKMSAMEEAAKEAYNEIAKIEKEMKKRTEEYHNDLNSFNLLDWNHDVAEYTWLKDMGGFRDTIAGYREIIKEWEDAYAESMDSVSESTTESVNEVKTAYEAVSDAVGGVTDKVADLLTAYNDAYQAAYESVSGQYNLWTQAEETIPMSIGSINSALDSQAEYWDNYKYNLDSLSERTKDIDGLSEIIASFADGSKESVNAIAGLADASDDELKELVKLYQKNAKMEEEVSKSLAQYRVDINTELDKMINDTQAAVDQMNMEDRARNSAKYTIDAYAEEILAGRGRIVDAAEYVKNALDTAWANSNRTVLSYDVTSYSDYAYDDISEYASGTDYAKAGIALVGEEGPELVMMRGGEQVVTAEDTKALFSGGGSKTEINISPNIVIAGDVSEDTEERIKASVMNAVLEALEQTGIDKRRSAYT